MYDFLCCGPKNTKYENVRIRFFAQKLKSEPDKLKVVVQAIENEVIVEDPIYEGFQSESEVEQYIEKSLDEGWFIFPWEESIYVRCKKHSDS